jgi:hypothetical protein
MQVNGFGFVPPISFFPGFLENSTSAGMPSEIVDKIYLNKIRVGGKKLVDFVIQKDRLLCVFQFNFVKHALNILVIQIKAKNGKPIYFSRSQSIQLDVLGVRFGEINKFGIVI